MPRDIPLDAYRQARIITARQFEAGNWLRTTWIKAGRQPRMTAAMDGMVSGASGDGEIVDKQDVTQTRAWRRFKGRLTRLDPVSASCVWNVCCMDEGAERWAARMGKPAHLGLVVLKAGLSEMFGGNSLAHDKPVE